MNKEKPQIFEASDYAGIKAGDFYLYYGYERIYCPRHDHAGMQDNTSCEHDNNAENDCDNDTEWCFVAKKGETVIAWYRKSDLDDLVRQENSCAQYLMAGIAAMLEGKKLS